MRSRLLGAAAAAMILLFAPDVFAGFDPILCSRTFAGDELVLEGFDQIVREVDALTLAASEFSRRDFADYDLQTQLFDPITVWRQAIHDKLGNWHPDGGDSSIETQDFLVRTGAKIRRLETDLDLWRERLLKSHTFAELIENHLLIIPHHLYSLKTDRGENIQVRFGRRLVTDFFWQTANTGVEEAAQHSLVAIQRGLRPDNSRVASGIGFLPGGNGHKIAKIQMTGHGFGAYRVYGVLENGIYNFVSFEHESVHDARYLSRATQHAAEAFDHEVWN